MPEGECAEAGDGAGGGSAGCHPRQGLTAIRPATREDLLAFYGKDRIGPSFKGIAGTLDGEVVAVAGLAYAGGHVFAFCSVKDEARPFKVHIHRTARRIIDEAKKRHRYIYAEADADEPGAAKWLRRLGFENLGGNVWRLSRHEP